MRFLLKRLAGMTKGGIAGLIAVLVLAAVAGFLLTGRFMKTTPHQCATCHPDLTAMWKRSKGHPAAQVTCYECHATHAEVPRSLNVLTYVRDSVIPAKYFSFDELIEARCRSCHEMAQVETEREKIVKLNHKVHLTSGKDARGQPLDMACLDCHRNIAHDKAQVETNRPTMAGCFTGECHRKDRNKDNCLRCHYQHLAEPDQTVL